MSKLASTFSLPQTIKKSFNNVVKKSLLLTIAFSAVVTSANATIVEFETNQGHFKVNLFDTTTPKTVENFLNYVEADHYNNSVIHRVVPDFIVQGGGFSYSGKWPLTKNKANASVINEPVYSNVAGTIAMAKLGNDINSATNQWFFNLNDNSSNLDNQNGGFTVFGQVIDGGMAVVNKIANIQLCQSIPMTDFTAEDCANSSAVPGLENFVVVYRVTVIDPSTVTDTDLSPAKSTASESEDDSSGGSVGWMGLLVLLFSSRRFFSKS